MNGWYSAPGKEGNKPPVPTVKELSAVNGWVSKPKEAASEAATEAPAEDTPKPKAKAKVKAKAKAKNRVM